MNWLLSLAMVLLVLWVLAQVLGWVLGAALQLLWIGALVLIAVWVFQKVSASA
jgi:hypothetical protein